MLGLLAVGSGCTSDDSDDEPDRDDPDQDEVGTQEPGGIREGWIRLRGHIFRTGVPDDLDPVGSDDERFADVDLWQDAFEQIATYVREDEHAVDDPELWNDLAAEKRDTDAAQRGIDVLETIPESTVAGLPDGKYVEHEVDGRATYTMVWLATPTAD